MRLTFIEDLVEHINCVKEHLKNGCWTTRWDMGDFLKYKEIPFEYGKVGFYARISSGKPTDLILARIIEELCWQIDKLAREKKENNEYLQNLLDEQRKIKSDKMYTIAGIPNGEE